MVLRTNPELHTKQALYPWAPPLVWELIAIRNRLAGCFFVWHGLWDPMTKAELVKESWTGLLDDVMELGVSV